MKTVIVTTSPKKHHRWANSTYAAQLVRLGCGGGDVLPLRGPKDYAAIAAACAEADALVLAMPLFVDSLPAHVLAFLEAMEEPARSWRCKVYGVSCCGFFEGRQTRFQLAQLRLWCQRAGLSYGGGLGVGSTEMLGTIRFTNLFACVPLGLLVGLIVGLCSGSAHSALVSGLISLGVSLALYLLWSSGFFWHTLRFGAGVGRLAQLPDRFTTVWFCGRPLFTFFASLFWVIRAACNRLPLWGMWKREDSGDCLPKA